MDLLAQNPFRILGLHPTATEREIAKRVSDLATYVEMGKNKNYPTDFPFLFPCVRTPALISEAAGRIEQPESRVYWSLFWFAPYNAVDELALDVLAQENADKAIALWEKGLGQGMEISQSNFHAACNLRVLYLAKSLNGKGKEYLEKGIKLTGRIFHSSFFDSYAKNIVGANASISRNRLAKQFVEEMFRIAAPKPEDHSALNGFVQIFGTFESTIGDYAVNKIVGAPLEEIDMAVSRAEAARKKSPDKGFDAGVLLDKETQKALELLKRVLGPSELKYQLAADNVAEELLQCSIDSFNVRHGKYPDASRDALLLANRSGELAIDARIKARLKENLATLNEIHERDLLRNRCWFCKQNPAVEYATANVEMHGDIQTEYIYNGTRMKWKTLSVQVPRCGRCKSAHGRFLATVMGLVVGAVMGFWLGEILGFAIGLFLGYVIGAAIDASRIPRGVGALSMRNDFPDVIRGLALGWALGRKPPGF